MASNITNSAKKVNPSKKGQIPEKMTKKPKTLRKNKFKIAGLSKILANKACTNCSACIYLAYIFDYMHMATTGDSEDPRAAAAAQMEAAKRPLSSLEQMKASVAAREAAADAKVDTSLRDPEQVAQVENESRAEADELAAAVEEAKIAKKENDAVNLEVQDSVIIHRKLQDAMKGNVLGGDAERAVRHVKEALIDLTALKLKLGEQEMTGSTRITQATKHALGAEIDTVSSLIETYNIRMEIQGKPAARTGYAERPGISTH